MCFQAAIVVSDDFLVCSIREGPRINEDKIPTSSLELKTSSEKMPKHQEFAP